MKGRTEVIHRERELTASMVPVLEAILGCGCQTLGELGRAIGAPHRGYITTYRNLCLRLCVPDVRVVEQMRYIRNIFADEEASNPTSGDTST